MRSAWERRWNPDVVGHAHRMRRVVGDRYRCRGCDFVMKECAIIEDLVKGGIPAECIGRMLRSWSA